MFGDLDLAALAERISAMPGVTLTKHEALAAVEAGIDHGRRLSDDDMRLFLAGQLTEDAAWRLSVWLNAQYLRLRYEREASGESYEEFLSRVEREEPP